MLKISKSQHEDKNTADLLRVPVAQPQRRRDRYSRTPWWRSSSTCTPTFHCSSMNPTQPATQWQWRWWNNNNNSSSSSSSSTITSSNTFTPISNRSSMNPIQPARNESEGDKTTTTTLVSPLGARASITSIFRLQSLNWRESILKNLLVLGKTWNT